MARRPVPQLRRGRLREPPARAGDHRRQRHRPLPNNLGGGIFNGGTLTVEGSTVSGNSAVNGGGILIREGTLTVANSTVSGNTASNDGGGIYNGGFLTSAGSSLIVAGSTISGNSADNNGGGIFNFSDDSTLTVANSTVNGNRATTGAGIWNEGTLTVANSTISGNSTTSALNGGGIRNYSSGTTEIESTIVAGNTATQAADCFNEGTLTSLGFNLEGGTSCGFTEDDDHQNVAVADVLVTANRAPLLADNGGPTRTIALVDADTNPAIDAIPFADCDVDTDQRGVSRPQPAGGDCDIGAFELMQEAPVSIADLLEPFDQAVEAGTLTGAGRGGSAAGRLNALRNMLLTAGALLEQGDVDGACAQLQDAADRTDGAAPPDDFVQGAAADELLGAITDVQYELSCFG